MKRSSLFVFVLSLLTAANAQTPQQSPTPSSATSDDVVRISTNLIQLDVTVTGKSGKPISDLSRDEIKIYENGKLQKISSLSFVPGSKPPPDNEIAEKSSSPNPLLPPTTSILPAQVRRTIAIVVDDGHLSWSSAFFVKKALRKYVDEQVQDGDLVALIRTVGGIGALQQFTTDKRLLRAAVENIKFYPQLGGWDIFGSSPTPEEEKLQSFRNEYYSFGAFYSLAYVIAGLNQMPGRKSIAFISDGFMPPGGCGKQKVTFSSSEYERAQQNVIAFANRSSVVINTIQAAGVESPGVTAADVIRSPTVGPGETDSILWTRLACTSERQRPLTILAEDTGGRVIVNNDIAKSIRRILDDQSYYLVAYEPDEETFDPKQRRFNRVEVKVSRPGVKVRSRSGFFGYTDDATEKPKLPQNSSLLDALLLPFAKNEIFVRMHAVYAADGDRKSYVKTFVTVNGSDLTFEKLPDNRYKTSFDIVAITVDARGRLLDERPKNYTLTLGEQEHTNILERGLITTFLVPIPGPGGFQVRLAVRDVSSEKVGSASQFVEIPDLNNKKLALSGLVLSASGSDELSSAGGTSEALRDTSLRQFKAGSVLNFGYQIFNARIDKARRTDLGVKLKLYRDGKIISDGGLVPAADLVDESNGIFSSKGSVRLNKDLPQGDYLLQIELIDALSGNKPKPAIQFLQFDIVE
ncbi:MAG TPA: VWA domain-containing protein [Pyrinomonadaceae bacterium]|nr:VWA domain-containing protein [Chloracidobacterium sp.]MBP9108092.1 VWA domain-containing protein [Pyrinomonadaceae bacterium]MBK7802093.1 VWA domain-containing protein [Chloracidobacterium sp.]MBK9437761.1 VWA domain-containing protein [Chloracidobacterium sp.]MBL0239641.1 VWA domain-containing protein [Chloracidobacterium sp.]